MGVAPKAREPGLSLAECIKRLDATPKTAEVELAVADFLMLTQREQMRILITALLQTNGHVEWCTEAIKRLTHYRDSPD